MMLWFTVTRSKQKTFKRPWVFSISTKKIKISSKKTCRKLKKRVNSCFKRWAKIHAKKSRKIERSQSISQGQSIQAWQWTSDTRLFRKCEKRDWLKGTRGSTTTHTSTISSWAASLVVRWNAHPRGSLVTILASTPRLLTSVSQHRQPKPTMTLKRFLVAHQKLICRCIENPSQLLNSPFKQLKLIFSWKKCANKENRLTNKRRNIKMNTKKSKMRSYSIKRPSLSNSKLLNSNKTKLRCKNNWKRRGRQQSLKYKNLGSSSETSMSIRWLSLLTQLFRGSKDCIKLRPSMQCRCTRANSNSWLISHAKKGFSDTKLRYLGTGDWWIKRLCANESWKR